MMTTQTGYGEYIEAIEAIRGTDAMIPLPDEAIREAEHVPVLAMIHTGDEPLLQTVSVLIAPAPGLPDLVFRRDLTPHAEPYQFPLGVVPTVDASGAERSFPDRARAALWIVRDAFDKNGLGRRRTSRPLLSAWPAAVILCPLVGDYPCYVGNAVITAAEEARLALPGAAGGPSDSGRYEIEWSSFRLWWDRAVAWEAVTAACRDLAGAWRRAVNARSAVPHVGVAEALAWMREFSEPWATGPRPDLPSGLPPDELPLDDSQPDSRVFYGRRGERKTAELLGRG